MTNHVHFTAPKQGQRIKGLEEDLRFWQRALLEIKADFDRAKQELAKGIDEMGAPADGRTVVFMYEASDLGPAGVYFETFEMAWDAKGRKFQPRTYEEGLAWAKRMAANGHPVEIPPPPTTLPTG